MSALESDLYAPVKRFLEAQGYEVKGEVKGCDVVGVRGEEPPVIVELKRRVSLELILQGVDRLAMSDAVYLAVPPNRRGINPRDTAVRALCRRVGLGLLIVHGAEIEVVLDPLPYQPRRNRARQALLLGEHARRQGDPNRGGSTRVPIMTAYRQEALRCALGLRANGAMKVAELRRLAEAPNAAKILYDDVYGWFERVGRGTYRLSKGGEEGLARFSPP
ncbi:MAG TPA: DUF2161 family putative PD-(D/E)XK-type phosphodiesterase [Stellaceae bacterium]|nr:DUF2161 family putative PD-(D/E)XK-type phosphodiesterase [Stellaceae bacterium]